MNDPGMRFKLIWGDMTLELKGDAVAVHRELESLKASGIGRIADFFALRDSLICPEPAPSPPPGVPPAPAPTPTPGPVPVPTPGLDGGPPPAPHGDIFRFALDSLRLPTDSADADSMAANIDNDPMGRRDNQFGKIIAAIILASGSQNIDLTSIPPLGAEPGSVAPLLSVQSLDPTLRNDASATVVLMRGARSEAEGTFTPDPSVAPVSFFGPLINGHLVSEPRFGPAAPVTVTIPGRLAMELPVISARIELFVMGIDSITGAIQGAVSLDAFKDAFLSSLAQLIVTVLANEPDSESARALVGVFGEDAEPGTIVTVEQWRQVLEQNSLIRTLVGSDVVVDGTPAVSFAIGFTARPAIY